MTLAELTGKMYYSQKVRVYTVDKHDRLQKTLVANIDNSQFRSDLFNPLLSKTVIGFGIASDTPVATIDINIEEE